MLAKINALPKDLGKADVNLDAERIQMTRSRQSERIETHVPRSAHVEQAGRAGKTNKARKLRKGDFVYSRHKRPPHNESLDTVIQPPPRGDIANVPRPLWQPKSGQESIR